MFIKECIVDIKSALVGFRCSGAPYNEIYEENIYRLVVSEEDFYIGDIILCEDYVYPSSVLVIKKILKIYKEA